LALIASENFQHLFRSPYVVRVLYTCVDFVCYEFGVGGVRSILLSACGGSERADASNSSAATSRAISLPKSSSLSVESELSVVLLRKC
jgi:hypothetical protein